MTPHEQHVLSENPLLRVRQLGQSIWLDFIRRGMILVIAAVALVVFATWLRGKLMSR